MSFLPYTIIITVLLIIGLAGSFYVYERVDANLQKHILDRTNTIALMVDYENLKLLSGTEADLTDARYRAMKATLQLVRLANPDVRFIYIVGERNGQLFFYMDSERSDSEDYSPPGQTYDEASEMMYRVFATGQSYSEEITDRWGTWVSGSAPIYDQYGQVIALLGMDVPANQYQRNALFYASIPFLVSILISVLIGLVLRTRQQELAYITHKSEFLSIASHEIRAPLTGIRWALGSLVKSASTSDSDRNLLVRAHNNTIALIYRISNFLSVTALEGGRHEPKLEEVSLRTTVEEVFNDVALSAEERKVKLQIDPSVSNVQIKANQEYLRQVLFNIVVNGVKYTKEGTSVTVSYAKTLAAHEVRVRDEGEGIPPEDRERIFGGYERTKAAIASKQEGTGLGLYLTREAMKAQHGSIKVDSTVGVGTTFILLFPL